jgi:DNA repair exonuclease SbcCD ATPase subunit
MNLSELFASVGERLKAKAEQRAQTFAELVAAVDSGKPPKPDTIASILEDSGRSVADLQSAVELVRQRRQWEAEAAEHDAHHAETHAVAELLAAEEERYKRALIELRQQHTAAVAALQARYQAAVSGIDRANTARNKLIETSHQRDELYVLWKRRATAIRAKDNSDGYGRNHQAELALAEARVASIKARIRKSESTPPGMVREPLGELQQQLASANAAVALCKAQLAELDQAAAAADSKAKELEAEALRA